MDISPVGRVRTVVVGLAAALTLALPPAVRGQEREGMRLDAAAARLNPSLQAPPPSRRDSVVNGTLIGAGVGFGAGFLTLAAFNAKETNSGPVWSGENVGYYTAAGIVGAGIGAVVGAITDAAIRRNTRAPVRARPVAVIPVYRHAAYGLRVTVRY